MSQSRSPGGDAVTWSIVAHDPASGGFAVAIATCSLAVGASCPFVRAGVGAVATQSFTNRYLGPAVLDGMARGLAPQDAIAGALAGDAGEGLRQVHAVDRHGRHAAHTGRNCVEWCASVSAPGFGVAGNMLGGKDVIARTVKAYAQGDALPLALRLLGAMDAGEAAGGDRRGRQSAAIRIVTTEDFPDCDLRVDDHPQPLAELRRLVKLWLPDAELRRRAAPSKENPAGFLDLDAIEEAWMARGLDLRFRR
jgi:uncharacterized Ntn-hydrolase superfamily protein